MPSFYIYELDKKPIKDDLLSNADTEFFYSLRQSWDHVIDGIDAKEEFKDLCESLMSQAPGHISYTDNSITFLPGFRKQYLKKSYNALLNQIESLSLEKFSNDSFIYSLANSIYPRHDNLIYMDMDYKGFTAFIRQLNDDKPTTYYFGGVVALYY